MGMSASQARLLSITARMNDVEFKSQSISNTKIRLADEAEEVSKAYTEALNASKLVYTDWSSGKAVQVDVTLGTLKLGNGGTTEGIMHASGYRLCKTGSSTPLSDDELTALGSNSYDLYEMIESGQYYLAKEDSENPSTYNQISVSGDNALAIGTVDSVKLAKAEADYNAATSRINRKEKLLDNELKALDTEHSALKTEQDSIKSLISENVDKTFNIFS